MSLRLVGLAGALALASCAATRPYSAIYVQELEAPASEPEGLESPHEGEAEDEGEVGRQAFNIFLGGAIEDGDAEGYGLGIDYEYRAAEEWGIGFFFERVDGIERSLAAGLQLYTRVLGEVVLVAGTGGERVDGDWTPIGRLGLVYEFEIDEHYFVAPGVFYDFGENVDVVVYGLDIGYAW